MNVASAYEIEFDRWSIKVTANNEGTNYDDCDGEVNLPLHVLNNYLAIGADAAVALKFHQARIAGTQDFKTRWDNKEYYFVESVKDLVRRKWGTLSGMVTLECTYENGAVENLTPKLVENGVHAVLVINIPSYAKGTKPWKGEQNTCDEKIEVVGYTIFEYAMLHLGLHGKSIAQCHSVTIVTTQSIPMKVDGEPVELKPSTIKINYFKQSTMLVKREPDQTVEPVCTRK